MGRSEKEHWQAIAAGLRIALDKRLPDMGAMTPGELRDFIGACERAEEFEMEVEAREERLARKQQLWNAD